MPKQERPAQPEWLPVCGPVGLDTPLSTYMSSLGALKPPVGDPQIGYTALTDTTSSVQAIRVLFHDRGRGFHYTVPVKDLVANQDVPSSRWTPVREGDRLIDLRAGRSLLDLWQTEVAPRTVETHALQANTAFRDSRIAHAAQLPSAEEAIVYLNGEIYASLSGQWDNALALALVMDPQHPAHAQLVPQSLQKAISTVRSDGTIAREVLNGLPLQEGRNFRLSPLTDELYHLQVVAAQIQAIKAGFTKHQFGEAPEKLNHALMRLATRRQKIERAILADIAYLSPGLTQEQCVAHLNDQVGKLTGASGLIG